MQPQATIDRSIPGDPSPQTRRSRRLVAVLGSAAAALVAWLIIDPVAGAELRAPSFDGAAGMEIGAGSVIVVALVATTIAWGLLALLERTVSRPRTVWTAIAVVGAALSLTGPFAGEGAETSRRLLLALMHVVVAGVAIPLLRRTARDTPREDRS